MKILNVITTNITWHCLGVVKYEVLMKNRSSKLNGRHVWIVTVHGLHVSLNMTLDSDRNILSSR